MNEFKRLADSIETIRPDILLTEQQWIDIGNAQDIITAFANVSADEPNDYRCKDSWGVSVCSEEYADWHKAKHMQLAVRVAELEQFKEWAEPQIARPVEQAVIEDTNRQLEQLRQQLAEAHYLLNQVNISKTKEIEKYLYSEGDETDWIRRRDATIAQQGEPT